MNGCAGQGTNGGAECSERSEVSQGRFTIRLPNLNEKGVGECGGSSGLVSVNPFIHLIKY